jgi:hypothetical protein
LHPIAEKHRLGLAKAKPDALGLVSVRSQDLFRCEVSQAMVPKLARALDATVCELEDRDYGFESGDNEHEGLRIARDDDQVGLRWSKATLEIEREPTTVDKRKPSWTWQLKETKASGQLSIEVSAMGLKGKRKWTEGEGRSLEEMLGVVLEKVDSIFRRFDEQRLREAERAKQWKEEAKRQVEREAEEAEKEAKAEKERKEREKVRRHEAKLEEIAEARRDNLATAAQEWIEAQGVVAYIEYCEHQWRQAGGGELSTVQRDWVEWARAEARKMGPLAKGYPNPVADGRLDASSIPVGGPYPEVKVLEVTAEPAAAPAAPEEKAGYAQVQRPPEQFPFWLLHRRR